MKKIIEKSFINLYNLANIINIKLAIVGVKSLVFQKKNITYLRKPKLELGKSKSLKIHKCHFFHSANTFVESIILMSS